MRATLGYKGFKLQGCHGFKLTTELIVDSSSLYAELSGLFKSDENPLFSTSDISTLNPDYFKKTDTSKSRN